MTHVIDVLRYENGRTPHSREDHVAVEEPLEIRVEGQPVAVAMRTPGSDRELAAGWAVSEGIVRLRADLAEVVTRPGDEAQPGAMADILLRNPASFQVARHRRNVFTTASCGLCGAASIDQALRNFPPLTTAFQVDASLLLQLPDRLRAAQPAFQKTGGVHGCALFDANGALVESREDVGRHNALDKLIGWALLNDGLPLSACVLLLSGRVSFEMVQKALAAGIPVIAAIGAPSSLAVDLARKSGQGLAAFLRGSAMNVYSGPERLRGAGGL